MSNGSYWGKFARDRITRRRALQMAALGAASAGAIAVVGCGGGDDDEPSGGETPSGGNTPAAGAIKRGGVIRGTLPFITGKDPHPASSFIPHAVGSYTYSRLMRFKTAEGVLPAEDRYRAVPELAQSFEKVDETTYIFTLNPAAKMHNVPPTNGRAVTAEDVVYSYQRYTEKSPNKTNLNGIVDSVTASSDGKQVTFKLKAPFGLFLERIASYQDLWIVPKELVDANLTEETPVGSGPFLFDVFTPGEKAAWKRNPDYFEQGADGQALPYLDGVEIVLIVDQAQVIAQFSAGQLDTISPSAQLVSTLPSSAIVDKAPRNILNFLYFEPGSYTEDKAPFNDDRVRRGFSRAIDREGLLGVASPADGGQWANMPLQPGLSEYWWLDPQGSEIGAAGDNYKFDVAEARALFSAAGVTNLSVPMHFSSNVYNIVVPYYDTVRQALPSMLNEAGVTVDPQGHEYSSDYIPNIFAGNFQGFALGLESVFSDVGSYWVAMFYDRAAGGIRNHSSVNDETLRSRIASMLELQDIEEIRDASVELQKYSSEKMYYVPLINPVEYTARQARMKGVVNTEGPTTYAVGTEGALTVWVDA